MSADPFFLSTVVKRAAELRTAHYAKTITLKWSLLTDTQKVPWIVKAHQELGGTGTSRGSAT